MGAITNQWLLGNAKRDRYHFPITVSISSYCVSGSKDDWVSDNKIVAEIRAERRSGDYQCLYLTNEDLEGTLPKLTQAAELRTQLKVAFDLLQGLSDVALLAFLSELLPSRSGVFGTHPDVE